MHSLANISQYNDGIFVESNECVCLCFECEHGISLLSFENSPLIIIYNNEKDCPQEEKI